MHHKSLSVFVRFLKVNPNLEKSGSKNASIHLWFFHRSLKMISLIEENLSSQKYASWALKRSILQKCTLFSWYSLNPKDFHLILEPQNRVLLCFAFLSWLLSIWCVEFEQIQANIQDKDGVKDSAVDTIVLYRVTKNQIDHIWVLEGMRPQPECTIEKHQASFHLPFVFQVLTWLLDDNQLLQNPHLGKDDILRCTFWTRVTFLSCRDLPGRVLFVYNNYELSEDKLGFGLGTTSFQETWEIAPDNRTD